MDLIDRETVIRGIVQTAAKKELDVEVIADVINVLEHTPSAEPVRCKDCKFYDGRPCGIVDWYNTADDFCSRAERRTE